MTVVKLIKTIGMERLLQDLIDELDITLQDLKLDANEESIIQLKSDLEIALKHYKGRHEDEDEAEFPHDENFPVQDLGGGWYESEDGINRWWV